MSSKPYFHDDHWCVDGEHQTHRFTEKHLAYAFAQRRGWHEETSDNVIQLHPPMKQHRHTTSAIMDDNLKRHRRDQAVSVFWQNFGIACFAVFVITIAFSLFVG